MTAEEARTEPLTSAELAAEKVMVALVLKLARERALAKLELAYSLDKRYCAQEV